MQNAFRIPRLSFHVAVLSRIDCKVYTYNNLLSALSDLSARGASVFPIGESVAGRMILCVRVGDGCGAQLLVHGGIHAREHLTAALVAAMARYALEKPLPPHTGAYFVPMVNPDGVSLSQFGLRSLRDGSLRRAAAGLNAGEPDFTMWKANAAGVDLNCHFDAAWGEGARNVTTPGAHGYIGKAPGTAPESVALLSLTARVHPAVTVSYHCKGEEIYWDFGQSGRRRARDFALGKALAARTGYRLAGAETDPRDADCHATAARLGTAGGYKDYCVLRLGIPAFTVEVVPERYAYPIPYAPCLADAYQKNKDIPHILLKRYERNR